MNEDRARRIEKQKAERAAYEETKRSEVNERLLEEASAPAYVFPSPCDPLLICYTVMNVRSKTLAR